MCCESKKRSEKYFCINFVICKAVLVCDLGDILSGLRWLVSAVMSMCTGAKTVVRTVYGNSNGFEVKVGMY